MVHDGMQSQDCVILERLSVIVSANVYCLVMAGQYYTYTKYRLT